MSTASFQESLKMRKANFCNSLTHTWLIGGLFDASLKIYCHALYEFLYLLVWSILPFALGALTLYVTSSDVDKSFWQFAWSTIQNGELLVFTISMLAPILYMTLYDPEKAAPFPHKLPMSTVVALIVVISAVLFALLKAKAVKDFYFVINFSVILTLLALIFRFLALVYHRARLKSVNETVLRQPENDFVSGYRSHREHLDPPKEQTETPADLVQALNAHHGGPQ